MRILFWGTPDFAVPSLIAAHGAGHAIVGAVTQPDRPAGRGRKLRASPVKTEAGRLGVPVLQPERARGEDLREQLARLEPDISVVAAYGRLLSDDVLALPPLGSINVHGSLLPELRGAAPVNWAIIRGHHTGGVTIMRMVREMDAGPILNQASTPVGATETAGELYARTADLGAAALVETLAGLDAGAVTEREQEHERATCAPKLDRAAARLDWSLPAEELSRWIRGCDPWPGAWSRHGEQAVQLFRPSIEPESGGVRPGTVVEADPRLGLLVAAGSGSLRLGEVKPAGRARMDAAAWIRGRGIASGDRFE